MNQVTNLSNQELISEALNNNEGVLAANGALSTVTGLRTGRSPNDRFVVKESSTEEFEVLQEDKDSWIEFVERVGSKENPVLVPLSQQEFLDKKEAHSSITQDFLKEITEKRNLNAPGLIPFELGFSIKGISGMKIGQAFKINEFFLPSRYQGRTAFIITGIDHKVQNNEWKTDIATQLIIT